MITRSICVTSFSDSEAPAEAIFSLWERVQAGRESLTLEHVLVRIAREGTKMTKKCLHELSQWTTTRASEEESMQLQTGKFKKENIIGHRVIS